QSRLTVTSRSALFPCGRLVIQRATRISTLVTATAMVATVTMGCGSEYRELCKCASTTVRGNLLAISYQPSVVSCQLCRRCRMKRRGLVRLKGMTDHSGGSLRFSSLLAIQEVVVCGRGIY